MTGAYSTVSVAAAVVAVSVLLVKTAWYWLPSSAAASVGVV